MMKASRVSFFVTILALVVGLSLLVPQPAVSQFASQSGWGGTTTGSANAQLIAVANYRKNIGVPISAIAGFTNTNQTVININGTGAVTLARTTANAGTVNLIGGELVQGQVFTVYWDGTVYRLLTTTPDVVGSTIEMRTSFVPLGWAVEDGSCQSQTDTRFYVLYSLIGTAYGNCGAGTFNLPDSRGRTAVALDNQGGAGAAGRITNCTWTALNNSNCGIQNGSLTSVNQLPPYTPGGTVAGSITGTATGGTITGSATGGTITGTATGTVSGTVAGNVSDPRTWKLSNSAIGSIVTTLPYTYSAAGGNSYGPDSLGGGGQGQVTVTGGPATFSASLASGTLNGGSISGSITSNASVTGSITSGASISGSLSGGTLSGTPVGSSAAFNVLQPMTPIIRLIKL